jgi:chromosome segregation ATPase
MRNRNQFLAILGAALAPLCFGQSSGPDANTVNAILAELRSIHEDMRASQTMQVLLAELQMEQGAVNRATDRVDDARSKLLQVQTGEKAALAQLAEAEDHLSAASDPGDQARWKDEIERLQGNVAVMKTEDQARSGALDEAQTKLRDAQDTLDSTQDELNALIKRITPAQSSPPAR